MPHILQLSQSGILKNVSPNNTTGRTYTLTSEETKLTAERKHTSVTSTNQDERTL
jgi:hypothetical protein